MLAPGVKCVSCHFHERVPWLCWKCIDFCSLSRASIPEGSQKCDHFHAFAGVILRYPGENAVLSDKGGAELKKQKRFQCHAILSEKPIALTAPCTMAIYLGNSDYFMINDILPGNRK